MRKLPLSTNQREKSGDHHEFLIRLKALSVKTHIDLILPTLNPPDGWADETFSRLKALEKLVGAQIHLIVSDDGSDRRAELERIESKAAHISVVRALKNSGKGAALRNGMVRAESDIILFTDADFPYELQSMQAIIESLEGGADVALGYREEDYYASVPWFRKGLSESFRFVLKRILKFPITDTQCGLKGMNQTGKSIFLQTSINRFLVDMEFIKRAVRGNTRIEPVVVQLRPNVQFSSMGLGVLMRELLNFVRIFFI